MKRHVYEILKNEYPFDLTIGENRSFSVFPIGDGYALCRLKNTKDDVAGNMRVRESRFDSMTYEEFCTLLDVMEKKVLPQKDLDKDCLDER